MPELTAADMQNLWDFMESQPPVKYIIIGPRAANAMFDIAIYGIEHRIAYFYHRLFYHAWTSRRIAYFQIAIASLYEDIAELKQKTQMI